MPTSPPANADAVALLSGGLDSCVALAEALGRHAGPAVAILHAGYGQRTAGRERTACDAICDHYRLGRRLVVDLPHLGAIGGSSLTDPAIPVPRGEAEGRAVPTTYVPFRNATLLAAAVAWAETLGAREVYCGAHAPGSTYPDTQPAFFQAFNRLVAVATPAGVAIRVVAPLLDLDKGGIVRRGLALAAPLHLTWSCYARSDVPCATCRSCQLRAEGFAAAGAPDPLIRR